jgi:hypothetical protein
MGRLRAIGHRRALIGVIAVAALALKDGGGTG